MKAKILSIMLTFFIISHNAESQNTFKRFYAGGFGIDETYQVDSLYYSQGEYYYVFDSVGQIANFTPLRYKVGADQSSFRRSVLKGNFFYSTGQAYGLPYFQLYKTNFLGNIIWKKSYLTNSGVRDLPRIYETNRNGFFICAAEQNGGVIYDLDSLGELNGRYLININVPNDRVVYANELADSSIFAGLQIPGLGTCFARFDTLGNVLWAKSVIRQNVFSSVINNNNGTYTFLSSSDTSTTWGQPFSPPTVLCTIDTGGNVLWAKSYDFDLISFTSFTFASYSSAISTSDGGYLILSSVLSGSNTDVLLIKTNMNGDTLWTRTHGSASSNEGGGKVIQTTDGGYLICSYSTAYPAYTLGAGGIYLIKTDSLGHTSTLCQEGSYPIPVNIIFPNDSNITLTVTIDSIGQTPLTIVVDTAFYFSLDGCTLTGVSDGINNGSKSIRVYPNPARQNITLELPEIPQIKDYYTVYDSVGKIVFQKPLNNKKQNIDVSNFRKGFYSIKVVHGNEVNYSKVVVK